MMDPTEASAAHGLGATQIRSLLLLCARTRLDAAATAELRTLAEGDVDWASLLVAAAEHAVAPLVCRRLEDVARDALPLHWRDRFRDALMCNVQRNLFLTSELFRVLAALEVRSVQAVPHKGPVLAAQVYGDVALRQFADLDLVLLQRQIPIAHDVLTALGYRSEIPWAAGPETARIPGHYFYTDGSGRINLELHSEATLRYFPAPLNLDRLLSRLDYVDVCGRRVATFAAEDALPMLCVHGAKHFWEKLSWVADISELVQIHRGFQWPRAMDQARRLGATRMLLLGLGVARDLVGTPLPAEILRQIGGDRAVSGLARRIREQFMNETPVRPSVLRRFCIRAQMRGSSWDGLSYAFRLAMSPTEEDWNFLRLPPALSPLYAVLRPMRMLRER